MKNLLLKVINSLLIILAIPLSATYCTSCGKNVYPTYLLDPEFRQYVIFPKGSYWIYEEVNTKQKDSIYIDYQDIYVTDQLYSYNSEFARQGFASKVFSLGFIGYAYAKDTSKSISYYKESLNANEAGTGIVFFKGKIGQVVDVDETSSVRYEKLYPTLNINNIIGVEVKVFINLKQNDLTQSKSVYYAKDVGVIKKELFNGQVWELIRYKINK